MRCPNYCGSTCADGTCPDALANYYPEYEHCSCEECGCYEGCEDCYFTDECDESEKEKYKDE